MISQHTIKLKERGETQAHKDICLNCTAEKCNGECEKFTQEKKKLQAKYKKEIITY